MDQHQFQSDIDHTHVCRVGAWSISVWLPSALNLRSSEMSRVFRMFRHLGWRSKCIPATTWGITTIPLLQNSAVVMMTVLSRQLWHRRWSLWQLPVPPVPTNLALRPFSGFREVWIPAVGGHCVWLVTSLQWRHNGELASQITTHCLLNRLLERRSKKTSKLRVTGLCAGNSPVTGEFPHKWPVTRKIFPFDDVIMCACPTIWYHTVQTCLISWVIHLLIWSLRPGHAYM